jgi:hypothetical protein
MFSSNSLDWFNAPTRIRSDEYDAAAKQVGNTDTLTRQTTSMGAGCSDTLNPASAMADQPGMIARGGFGQPGGGCAVDENTELRWGVPGAWRQKGKHELWARPFATTPNLGGGDATAVDDESNLIHSALIRNRKEANTFMDQSIPNFYQPLLDVKASEYANPNNWVQSWTWGGDSTRLVQTKRVGDK